MEPGEREAAKRRRRQRSNRVDSGHDALAIYLHPDNPLNTITLDELAQVE